MASSSMTPDWSRLEFARSYAEHGWAVLPLHSIEEGKCTCGKACLSPGKHPFSKLAPHGVKSASKDVDLIQSWWIEYPRANIGIATGEVSGMVAVDVDPRNGGWESLPTLNLPETKTSQTGGGGLHCLFHHSGPLASRLLAKGIELKGDGGYVVAVPSNHLLGDYSWIDDREVLTELPFSLNGGAKGHIEWDDAADDWDDETLLSHARKATNGQKFVDLFDEGLTADYNGDDSSADMALCCLLAFWTNKDTPRMDRLFRQSALFRDKWDEKRGKQTYGERTIAKAVEVVSEGYGETPHAEEAGQEAPKPDSPTWQVWTATSLLEADFPPLTWIVEDLLPEGLVFLAGRPKRGKSWLALQIALDVVSGHHSLGPTTAGRVLYVALEDSPRRLQSRLRQMGASSSEDLIFINELSSLDNGGYKQLLKMLDVYKPALIVIDTLARVMGRKRDQDSNSEMTDFLAPLQVLASQRHCCILLIDHHRKPGAEIVDMIDDIAGSTAKTAVADAIIGLYRKSGEDTAQLKITGRDVEEKDLTLTWNSLKFHWTLELNAKLNATETRVIAFIREIKEAKAATVAADLGVGLRAAQIILSKLVEIGLLSREAIDSGVRGRPNFLYRLAGPR